MQPEGTPAGARRVVLLLVSATLVLAAGGALWFVRFASRARRQPALVYRDPATLDQLLKRANDAEHAGDRATAITSYRFVVAVGQGAGAELAPYVGAAPPGLTRLGAASVDSSPPR